MMENAVRFRDARTGVLRITESDSDDEEEYVIERNSFGTPIYNQKPATQLKGNKQETMGGQDHEADSLRNKCSRQNEIMEELLLSEDMLHKMGYDGEIDDILRIRLREAKSNEEIFTFFAWIRAFNINEPIYPKLCYEFYSTYEFDEFARRLGLYHAAELDEEGFDVNFQGGLRSDEHFSAQEYWLTISTEENLNLSRSSASKIRKPILRVTHKMITYSICQRTTGYDKIQRVGTQKDSQICYGQFISKLARKSRVLTDEVKRSLSVLIYCRELDTTTLRELIDPEGSLIPEVPHVGASRVGIPIPPRVSMNDLYDRMGRMEIRQEARWSTGSLITGTGIMECSSIWQGCTIFQCREPITHLDTLSPSMISITNSTIHSSHHSSRMMRSSVGMIRDDEEKKERAEIEAI
ncbi:hypothetical protein Tco_0846870 [Tanacetum coccineum]